MIKVTSELIPHPKIEYCTKRRTELWFGEFRYAANVYFSWASILRGLDHDLINGHIEIRRKIGERPSWNYGGSWRTRRTLTGDDATNLHLMCDFLREFDNPRLVFSSDWIYFYTNEIKEAQKICSATYLTTHATRKITTVVLKGQPGTICLKNPQHDYRTYFKNLRLDPTTRQRLYNFLTAQQDICPSPSFQEWLERDFKMLQAHLFFDHNGTGVLTMLSMIAPGTIRKTLPIVPDK